MRIGVISGRFPRTEFSSALNHYAYCKRHSYSYVHCCWPTGEPNPYFNKIQYLLSYVDVFDLLFWIDDDAFFLELGRPLDDFLPRDDELLVICSSPSHKDLKTVVSTGQFGLRGGARGRALLEDIAATDLAVVQRWWTDDLGFFTNGDQDALVYLLKTRPEYEHHVRIEPHVSFNRRPEELLDMGLHDLFLVHFTGSVSTKRRLYREVQSYTGRGPSLLPRIVDLELAPAGELAPRPSAPARFIDRIYRMTRSGISAGLSVIKGPRL